MDQASASPAAGHPPYIPPYPHRWAKAPPVWTLLSLARRNLLSIWEEKAFDYQFFGANLFLQPVFVANSPDVVQTVFLERAANYHSKSPQQRHALAPLLGDGLFVSDGETWAERRRVISQVTHVSRMGALAPVMSEVAGEWADRWAAIPPGTTIDVLSEMAQLTAEIICRSIFGRALKPGTAREVVDAFSDYQAAIAQMDFLSLLGLPDLLPRLHGRRVRRSAARIRAVVEELVDTILADGENGGPSLIGAMAAADSPVTGKPMTRDAFRNEAIVLFMAGHETTANTLAWAWFLLSQAPWAAAAVQAEADALGGRPATHADLGRLPYTQGVIQETLRLYPPVPLQARRAAADDRIRNRAVPKGSLVILIPWLLHRHQRLWERPDAFEPERWLPGGTGAPSRYAYVPFSIGPRVCTGAAFGLTEAVICLATLAARFKLTLAAGHVVEPVCRLTLRPGETLPMVLEGR
jgi:cytochrome P450